MTLIARPVISDRLGTGRLAIEQLVESKADTVVSPCVPARDEAVTVAGVVEIAAALRTVGLIDEIIAIDDGSSDATTARASAAGARVLSNPESPGKGEALRLAVATARGDLLVFLDADVTNYTASSLTRLIAPLLLDPSVQLVKAAYRRPLDGRAGQGGRVTELLARPLLERFHPELAQIAQPLAGETAVRRAALNRLTLAAGYGIKIALLIDVYLAHGIDAIAEVDLGERIHRNRPLTQFRPQARDILDAVPARTPPVTNLLGELS